MSAHTSELGVAATCAACGTALAPGADVCPQCGAANVRPATLAARMAALTVDVAAVAIVTSVVVLATHSIGLGLAAAAEATLALWILQARSGLGLGNALMRLRTARLDKPYSPGGTRALVRGACTTVGLGVLAVGAWLLELSGLADRSGWHRTWADRLAGTVVVEVPRAQRSVEQATAPAAAVTRRGMLSPDPHASLTHTAPPPAAPLDVRSVAPSAIPPMPAPPIVAAPGPRRATAMPPEVPAPPAPVSRRSARAAQSAIAADGSPPSAPGPRRSTAPAQTAASAASTLLLVFDTGQRVPVAVPCVVDLGRNPEPVEDGDLVVSVDDPERTVSNVHVRLEIGVEDAWATDLGSTNGSDLLTEDGTARALVPHQRTFVEDGTRVRLGNRTVTMTRLAGDAV